MTVLYLIFNVYWWLSKVFFVSKRAFFSSTKQQFNINAKANEICFRYSKKPEWVTQEIITLKALLPTKGCRKIAEHFNRKHSQKNNMTVGKTYVYETLKNHHYEVLLLRRKIKHKRPKQLPKNQVWGIDLTTVTDENKKQSIILGMVDYGSRVCVTLEHLDNKSSITLLGSLFKTIWKCGKPKKIITDNEAVFNSKLFNAGLTLLGIAHQTTDIASPWQNGRIERFFGTFKNKTRQFVFRNSQQLALALPEFQVWYNHIRPHSYLDGKTPMEVWNGVDIFIQGYKNEYWFEAWDGLLTGFYLPT